MGRLFALLGFLLVTSCKSQEAPNLISSDFTANITEALAYYLYFPKDYEPEGEASFPILLFLHGGGEAGGELKAIKKSGPPRLIVEGKEFPFLILAPQHPHAKKWWNTAAVKQLLDEVVAKHNIDTDRIYLTGLSRGGGAAWELAVNYPETFAAMAVVCGMAPVPYAGWVNKEMPIWVFHGEEDEAIPFYESANMVEKLESMSHPIRFTRYPGVGHNAWDKAYATEELYDWFMAQEKKVTVVHQGAGEG